MHRTMADVMKAMGSGKRGALGSLGQMMGFGGGTTPSAEEMQKLAEKMQGGMPGLPPGIPQLPPNFPGVGGLPGLGKFPGLPGLPGGGKKK
jgi:signal recognition particle subunit SRP54